MSTTEAASETSASATTFLAATSTTTYLALVTLATLAVYFYRQATAERWTDYGVKEPKLSRFFFIVGDDFRAKFSSLLNQYGDIVGVRNNRDMVLLTTNFKLMRHILIKDFNNFVDRGDNIKSKTSFAKSLFFAKGQEWRRHRQIVSPTFSTGKLKYIAKSVDTSARSLAKYIEKHAENKTLVPMKCAASEYTGEVIAKVAFGLNADYIGKEEPEFLHYARTMVHSFLGIHRMIFQALDQIPHLRQLCITLFPTVQFFDAIDLEANKYFQTALAGTISERRRQRQNGVHRSHTDFLDLLLNANEAAVAGKLEKGELGDAEISEGVPLKAMTDTEMLGHSVLVIFAGMETTATTLQMSLTELASHPEIQEKVHQEIIETVKGETPTSEELNQLHYTEQVINETLRMYPPAPSVTRKAKETKTYEGITIPKGAVILLPYYHILKDPKVYPNPDKFDPDRFSPQEKEKRDPLAFVPFGQGPRLCVGMRLAYLELKVALVHILRNMKVVLNDKTEPKLGSDGVKFGPQGLLTPLKTVMLAFEKR